MRDLADAFMSILWAMAALGCGATAIGSTMRYFRDGYVGGRGGRLRKAIVEAALLGGVVVCGIMFVSHYQLGHEGMLMFPLALFTGSVVFAVGVPGLYRTLFLSQLLEKRPPESTMAWQELRRPSGSDQRKGLSLPGLLEGAGIAVTCWGFGAISFLEISYLMAEPRASGSTQGFVPLLVLIALAGFIGPVICYWSYRKRGSRI